FREAAKADAAGKAKIYADREFRHKFKEAFDKPRGGAIFSGGATWSRAWISWYPPDPSLEERSVADVAAERNLHPIDLALDLALATNLEARFRMAIFNHDEAEVAELLTKPDTVLGLSDAGAHASQLCDACFATHLLGHWTRETGILSLEQAVWRLTGQPVQIFGITDRGRIEEGLAADLVAFDPDTVGVDGELERVHD